MKYSSGSAKCKMVVCLTAMSMFVSCSPSGKEWLAQEQQWVKNYPATQDELVFVCWQKPVEKYEQLGAIRISINEEDLTHSENLQDVVAYMQKKAAQWGANALWLQHVKGKSIYKVNGDIIWKNFVQKDAKMITEKINTPYFLEAFALVLEDTKGTHGSDEFIGDAPLEVESI